MDLAIALHFGGNFGPASCEPINDAYCFPAENTQVSNELKMYIIQPEIDEFTIPVRTNNKFFPQAKKFVNNFLTAGPQIIKYNRCITPILVSPNIESSYILIGNPDPIQKPVLPQPCLGTKCGNEQLKSSRWL